MASVSSPFSARSAVLEADLFCFLLFFLSEKIGEKTTCKDYNNNKNGSRVEQSKSKYDLKIKCYYIAIWQSRQVSCQLDNIEGATCPRTYMVYIP
jgi:hypothetical protein